MSRNLLPDIAPEKDYQPAEWTTAHRHIVSLELAGFTPSEICAATGYSASRVSVILHDPRAQVDRDELSKAVLDKVSDVHVRFKMAANEAFDELLDELRHSADERVRQKSALAILDRGGYSKYQGEHVPRPPITEDVADRLIAAAAEISTARGPDYQLMPAEVIPSDSDDSDDD